MSLTRSQAAANRRGIMALSLAMASFMVNDAIVKYVAQSLGGAQLIFIRGLFATGLLLVAAQAMGATARLGEMLNGRVALRALLDALATLIYLTGLFHLPLANATAINMATPLFLCVLGIVFLHERITPMRWVAIASGFCGVLLVVQPRAEGFNVWALVCLAGTFLGAVRDLVTRVIPQSVPSIVLTAATAISVTILSAPVSVVQGWKPVDAAQLGLLATAAVFLATGYYLLINSLRAGDISVISPFRYTGLLYALVIGYVVWGDVPNPMAWAGTALLVAAGFAMLHGERRSRRVALKAVDSDE